MARPRDSARHEEVLDVAIELIRRRGIEATSLRDIADALEMRKQSLESYFSTKAELQALIHERFGRIADEGLDEIVARPGLDPESRLRELLQFHAEHCVLRISSPVLVSFVSLWTSSSESDPAHDRARGVYEARFRDAYLAGMAAGLFRPMDASIAVRGMLGAVTWPAFWYEEERHGPLRDVIDQIIEMCLGGVRAAR